jgi:hypothetical protein
MPASAAHTKMHCSHSGGAVVALQLKLKSDRAAEMQAPSMDTHVLHRCCTGDDHSDSHAQQPWSVCRCARSAVTVADHARVAVEGGSGVSRQ